MSGKPKIPRLKSHTFQTMLRLLLSLALSNSNSASLSRNRPKSGSNNRKPGSANRSSPTTVPTIQAALDKWILPEIGHLPLSETAKYPAMKALVAKMNAGGLSAQTVNSYFCMAAAVIESAEDAEGSRLYPSQVDANKLDLPMVETSKQRRLSITAETMAEFAEGENCRNIGDFDPRGFHRLSHWRASRPRNQGSAG